MIIGDNNTTLEVISETEGVQLGSSSSHDECAYSHGISSDVCSWAGRDLSPKERDSFDSPFPVNHAFFVYYENADLVYDVIRMRQLSKQTLHKLSPNDNS